MKKGYKSGSFNGFESVTVKDNTHISDDFVIIEERLCSEIENNLDIDISYTLFSGRELDNKIIAFDDSGDGYKIMLESSVGGLLKAGDKINITGYNAVCVEFLLENGNKAAERIEIGGEAEKTTLITQAGYLYAFPQGIRIPLLSDEPVEMLAADITISNLTEPSEAGGYSA